MTKDQEQRNDQGRRGWRRFLAEFAFMLSNAGAFRFSMAGLEAHGQADSLLKESEDPDNERQEKPDDKKARGNEAKKSVKESCQPLLVLKDLGTQRSSAGSEPICN